jgi:nitroreductase
LFVVRKAPSGSNLQPWHIYVLSGARLAALKERRRGLEQHAMLLFAGGIGGLIAARVVRDAVGQWP